MALVYKQGDAFTTELPAIGHGCNVKGAFGSGFALAVRRRYPEVHLAYLEACKQGAFLPGSAMPVKAHDGKWIINLASQVRPGKDARIDLIEDSMYAALQFCREEGLTGFAIPRIGAGIGGLEWDDVNSALNAIMSESENEGITLEVWAL